MKSPRPYIAAISDVSVGYGSPQIAAMVRSLMGHYAPATGFIFEPDQSERSPRPELFPDLEVVRVSTRFHPHSAQGIIEYNREVGKLLRDLRPDVLLLASPLVAAAIAMIPRPSFTMAYMLESASYYEEHTSKVMRLAALPLRQYAELIDLAVYPEENRAVSDISRGALAGRPIEIVYNTINQTASLERVIDPALRLRKLFYSGTIQPGVTCGEYYLRPEMQSIPIDLFGLLDGPEGQKLQTQLLALSGSVCYRGYVDSAVLADLRREYAYSIIIWAPTNHNQLYAAPNKFFEAIADGVPPITAPHPQCKMLVERYDCGIVMDNWSFEAFLAAIARGLRTFGTPRYAQMVENCRRAVLEELTWDRQFEKVRRWLPRLETGGALWTSPTSN